MGGWLFLKLVVLVLSAASAVSTGGSAGPDRVDNGPPYPPGGPPDAREDLTSDTVVFASNREGEPHLYVMDLPTGETERLTDEGGNYARPVYSPDGREISYGKDGDIYVMNSDGTDPRKVVSGPGQDYNPSWSPDGERLAYACERDDPDICIVDADGGNQRVITGPETQDYDPAWSPDGGRIAYSTRDHIYTMKPDGTDPVRITLPAESGVERYDPAWSPNGKKIMFVSNKTGSFQIHVNGPNGKLTGDGREDFAPAYSPDGERIIYTSGSRGGDEVYVMDYDGHNKRRLFESPDSVERQPDWRPEPGSSPAGENGVEASMTSRE